MPQLGLHPDQGAAALGRNLPLYEACQGLRAFGREDRLRRGRRGAAFARCVGPSQWWRYHAPEEEQGHGDLGRGEDPQGRDRRGLEIVEARHATPDSGAQGRSGAGDLCGQEHHHRHRCQAARPAGSRARRQAGLDLFRGHGAEGHAEVAAGGRLGCHRHRVRFLLQCHGRGRDSGRDHGTDHASRGCRDLQDRPETAGEAGSQDPHRRKGLCPQEG